jgi:hypothetical protein
LFRNCLTVVSAIAIAIVSYFAVSSIAVSSTNPDLSSSLPASSLPKATISAADQTAIYDLIPQDYAVSAGITPGSFANARVLRQTELGPIYVIPGAKGGVCLALASSVGCNDGPTDKRLVIAALTEDASGNVVGGGLVNSANTAIAIATVNGSQIRTKPTAGGFFIDSSQHVNSRDIKDLVPVG